MILQQLAVLNLDGSGGGGGDGGRGSDGRYEIVARCGCGTVGWWWYKRVLSRRHCGNSVEGRSSVIRGMSVKSGSCVVRVWSVVRRRRDGGEERMDGGG